jgi:cation:H+ antiporter
LVIMLSGLPSVAAGIVFLVSAAASLAASWLLVSRLEALAGRAGLSEGMLGLVAALAADAPEITAAVSALAHHQTHVGAGVTLGSNVFNLAALLGLGAAVAGWIGLHRKVIVLGGVVALWVAAVSLVVVTGLIPPLAGIVVVAVVFVPYVVVLAAEGWPDRLVLRPPAGMAGWLATAVAQEEAELEPALLDPALHSRPRGWRADAGVAVAALTAVVLASTVMELTATTLGDRLAVPGIVTGAIVLAAVTSLPNAVAAVYLANRGRGAAVLSTALNSNALNVIAGFLIPAAIIGLGPPSGTTTLVTAWYAGLTAAVLALSYRASGLRRGTGMAIIVAYLIFVGWLLAVAYQ